MSTFYLCSLGSNLSPVKNVPAAIRQLLRYLPEIAISPVIETPPANMKSALKFYNAVFWFECDYEPEEMKATFNAIEAQLGRDRMVPDSKTADRTIDLDILYAGPRVALSNLSLEDSYLEPLRPVLLGRRPSVPPITLVLDGMLFGDTACMIKALSRGFRRVPFPHRS